MYMSLVLTLQMPLILIYIKEPIEESEQDTFGQSLTQIFKCKVWLEESEQDTFGQNLIFSYV